MNLEQEFQKEMIQKMAQAKIECKYNPTRFNQMIARYGGVETAKRLIDGCIRTGIPSEGYTTLLMAGRTDLTLEDSVCNPKYSALFTKEEITMCRKLLGRD